MAPSQYTAPPPDYAPDQPSKSKHPDHEPLLSSTSNSPPSSPSHHGHKHHRRPPVQDAWPYTDDDGEAGGVPADFSGLTVSQSSIEIRLAFIRKVYSILFLQIAASALVGGLCRTQAARVFILQHSWTVIIPLLAAIVCMLFLYAKRHSSPANLILLSFFTVLEALGIGAAVAFVETTIVLEALALTGMIFIGLTLYTFQTKRDFTGMGPYLSAFLMTLIFTSFLGWFLPFNRTFDAIYAGFATLVFSAYIVWDTQVICKHLSPDEWVLATISLYLDLVNLFISIVRLLSDTSDR